ncbi:hypothetical protein [Streptomyces mirabilis]
MTTFLPSHMIGPSTAYPTSGECRERERVLADPGFSRSYGSWLP